MADGQLSPCSPATRRGFSTRSRNSTRGSIFAEPIRGSNPVSGETMATGSAFVGGLWRRSRDGSFLDIGCANGLLMESVVQWAGKDGHCLEPYGLDISEKLAELARQRLPRWRDRILVGNALLWEPPKCFDFVRTEMVYVPNARRREYMERLLTRVVAPGGRLIVCSYGSSRPEGAPNR